LANRALVDLP